MTSPLFASTPFAQDPSNAHMLAQGAASHLMGDILFSLPLVQIGGRKNPAPKNGKWRTLSKAERAVKITCLLEYGIYKWAELNHD